MRRAIEIGRTSRLSVLKMGSEARVRRGKFVEGSELLGIILSDLIKLVRHLIVEDILAIATYIVHLRVNIH